MKRKQLKETGMKIVFLIAACTSIAAVCLICLFLFVNGIPAIGKIGIFDFLLGTTWRPSNDLYGILPFILGSLYVTAGAIIIGVPIGIFAAVFLARFCPKPLYRVLKPAVNLMAGIPSIVYGFFGMVIIVPAIRAIFGGTGSNILTASILLGLMILPTIINLSESAIRAVPSSYYEGALALGATHERSVFFATLPAAKSGILAGVVLGIGRAIGETMAVIMVAGNAVAMPSGILSGVRTMTANIVTEMGYAAGLHREALIATGVVLFVFILLINLSFSLLKRRAR
ncbi:MAG: phosphate ABC transporter permease subunit PstC [Oscillospiraceae bacterium]|nr:phosphate ABC transporter permease subunit PstC [Oscillospiraceae bacterium]